MATAQQQLDAFLRKYSPDMEKLGRRAIQLMRKRLPGAICLVYDNYNGLVVGFGEVPAASRVPLSLALYPRWINLFFLMGAELDDPRGLLRGKGSRVRSIRLASLETLKDPAVDRLISAALLHANWKLDPRARGTIVIKSVSPRQRPRRP